MQNDHHLNDYCAADRRLAQMRQETSRDVLASMRGRLPEALFCAAGLAVVLLAGTGWLS